MTIENTVKKLRGHSSTLLSHYLGTLRSYAVLEPMLFDTSVLKTYGSGKASAGYKILQLNLYNHISLEINKLINEAGPKNASICTITKKLTDPKVVAVLKKDYLDNCGVGPDCEARKAEKAQSFDRYAEELKTLSDNLLASDEVKALIDARNSFFAHLEVTKNGDIFEASDLSEFGLTWGTPKKLLGDLKPIIERIGWVVRDAGFFWENFEHQNQKLANGYWVHKE